MGHPLYIYVMITSRVAEKRNSRSVAAKLVHVHHHVFGRSVAVVHRRRIRAIIRCG